MQHVCESGPLMPQLSDVCDPVFGLIGCEQPSAVSGRLDAFHARLAALVFNTAPPDFEHWVGRW